MQDSCEILQIQRINSRSNFFVFYRHHANVEYLRFPTGYYRVDYDETNWKRIAEYMNSENYEKIHVRNRAQLINDLSYMTTWGRQNYTTLLDLASYLVREDDYQPWIPAFRAIRKLRRSMFDEGVDKELKVDHSRNDTDRISQL